MAERKPRADLVRIAGNSLRADLSDVITEIALDFQAGSVAEARPHRGRSDGPP